jgi:hypothetical protein
MRDWSIDIVLGSVRCREDLSTVSALSVWLRPGSKGRPTWVRRPDPSLVESSFLDEIISLRPRSIVEPLFMLAWIFVSLLLLWLSRCVAGRADIISFAAGESAVGINESLELSAPLPPSSFDFLLR